MGQVVNDFDVQFGSNLVEVFVGIGFVVVDVELFGQFEQWVMVGQWVGFLYQCLYQCKVCLGLVFRFGKGDVYDVVVVNVDYGLYVGVIDVFGFWVYDFYVVVGYVELLYFVGVQGYDLFGVGVQEFFVVIGIGEQQVYDWVVEYYVFDVVYCYGSYGDGVFVVMWKSYGVWYSLDQCVVNEGY